MTATHIRTTSIDAYDHLRRIGKCGQQGRAILAALDNRAQGWTLQEIAKCTGIQINAVSGRVNEMKKRGVLIECQQRKCSITGRTVVPVQEPPQQLELLN